MTPPKWVMHEGTGHLMRLWDGMSAVTWCGTTIYGLHAADFREPKQARGEQDCRRCMDAKAKGD